MSMKSLKEYLTESAKTYNFRIRVAGEVPEGFEEKLHAGLARYGCSGVKKVATSPIQKHAKDFPQLENVEVTVFENTCEYPVTPQEIQQVINNVTGISETHYNIRNVNDPGEMEMNLATDEKSGEALLNDPSYKNAEKIKSKDYFGDDFNKGFLKDLQKASKERVRDAEVKPVKTKEDKAGTKSALGS